MERRWRWLSASLLLLAAGILTAVSVHRHWTPCRSDPSSARCLQLQTHTYGLPLWGDHAHRDLTASLLAMSAALALTLAWTFAFGWFRRGIFCTGVFCVIGLLPLLDAVLVAADLISPDTFLPLLSSGWVPLAAEISVIPLLLGAGWVLEPTNLRQLALLVVLGWGVTSYGSIHRFCDYLITMMVHPSPLMDQAIHPVPGQNPAGLGYATAITQMALAVALATICLVGRRRPRPDDERRGRDGFTLAA